MKPKRERAQVLREAGLSYNEIARYLHVAISTVYRWTNPDYEEHARAMSRAWKANNRDRTREYDEMYDQLHRGQCLTCGGPMGRHTLHDGRCAACRSSVWETQLSVIEGMWLAGWKLPEIEDVLADALGWTSGTVHRVFHNMRRDGWDLPYRYKGTKLQRAA